MVGEIVGEMVEEMVGEMAGKMVVEMVRVTVYSCTVYSEDPRDDF